jgi:hypothetical protein
LKNIINLQETSHFNEPVILLSFSAIHSIIGEVDDQYVN